MSSSTSKVEILLKVKVIKEKKLQKQLAKVLSKTLWIQDRIRSLIEEIHHSEQALVKVLTSHDHAIEKKYILELEQALVGLEEEKLKLLLEQQKVKESLKVAHENRKIIENIYKKRYTEQIIRRQNLTLE